MVAHDFVELVAIDGDIAAEAKGRAPPERPQHGEIAAASSTKTRARAS